MKIMNKTFLKLLSLAMIAVLSFTFSSCSDDDEESASNELTSVMIGAWSQDGDNDIFVIKANGMGFHYDCPEWYEHDENPNPVTWSCSDGLFVLSLGGDYEGQVEYMRAESVADNKIVWRRYEDPTDWELSYYEDEYGTYCLWTWERITNK